LLIATGDKNSLAASIELFSFLKNEHMIKLAYYEEEQTVIDIISSFIKVCRAIARINKAQIGVIGEPSDWLLHSKNINKFGEFNTKLLKFNTDKIVEFVSSFDESELEEVKPLLAHYEHSLEEVAINDSLKVYLAMKKLVTEQKLDGLTIRCFDLLQYKYTACMGMSFCNDEGIVAGCEGDLHATFSMMIGSYLTEKACWMANPSTISIKDNTLILAHCTVPSEMIVDDTNSRLTTHMESGLSVANHGPMKLGLVTIFRIGENFDKIVATTGEIFETDMRNPSLCRTQANIKLNSNVTDWMENTLGNHQVLVYGDITDDLKLFSEFTGIKFYFT
jgi:L-fucose isomerase-like protein